MVTEFSKTFSSQRLHQTVEWQVNKHFENHLFSHNWRTDKNRDGFQNASLLIVQPPDAAASARSLTEIRQRVVHQNLGFLIAHSIQLVVGCKLDNSRN